MSLPLEDRLLLAISTAKKQAIDGYKFGVFLASKSGLSLEELTENAVRDRLEFAEKTLKTAKSISRSRLLKGHHRLSIARSYYAFYHTARALAFFSEGGDDQQDHSSVGHSIPTDFPDRAIWQNRLKIARLDRNRADYEPYPVNERGFREIAQTTLKHSEEFLALAKGYLKKKGWVL